MADGSEEEAAVPPVDILDQVAVKRTIDDCLCKLAGLAGYPEDYTVGNIKLFLMTAACSVACYAQLGPHTFPENKSILIGCIGFYAVTCLALQILATFVEKNYVLRTYDKTGKTKSALMIATRLDRGEHMMTFKTEFRDSSIPGTESITRSVGCYFSPQGDLDEIALQKDFQTLIWAMEQRYDAIMSKKSS